MGAVRVVKHPMRANVVNVLRVAQAVQRKAVIAAALPIFATNRRKLRVFQTDVRVHQNDLSTWLLLLLRFALLLNMTQGNSNNSPHRSATMCHLN